MYKTCSEKPNREWDRTAALMIPQLVTESGHAFFSSSSAFQRGKLDIKEYGMKSTRFDDNEGNIEMLLRTVISVNQLSIHGCLPDWCKNWDRNSSEESAPSSDGSESSGTLCTFNALKMQDAHLAEMQQSLRPVHPQHQQRQRQNQQFEGGENFDYYVDRKTGWRYVREPRGNPPAASSSSTSQWPTSQRQTSWSSWQPTSSENWW